MFCKYIWLLICIFSCISAVSAQHPFERKWYLGGDHLRLGDTATAVNVLDFKPEGLEIQARPSFPLRARTYETNASICDNEGNLLFLTNGRILVDGNLRLFPGSDTLVDNSSFTWYSGRGYPFEKGALILPKPGNENEFVVISQSSQMLFNQVTPPMDFMAHVYYGIVGYEGASAVVHTKSNLLIGLITEDGLHATRHANNRDWWIVAREAFSDRKLVFLLDPEGIRHHHTDTIGIFHDRESAGSDRFTFGGIFSNQGDRLVYCTPWRGLELFRFDRATGRLSDFSHLNLRQISDFIYNGRVAFSPSGRFLYFSDIGSVWQMDLHAEIPNESVIKVAEWDGYLWQGRFPVSFGQMQRTPDCKIAIASPNLSPYIHLIQEPDKPGLLCQFEFRVIQLPLGEFERGLPNYPNFCLGEPCENYCDSLLQVSTREIHDRGIQVSIWPNPVSEQLNVQWEQEGRITRLLLHDMNGRIVRTQQVQGQAQCGIWVQDLPLGFYMLTVEDSYGYVYREKVVKR
jgi:hypothetical protein